MSGQLSYTYHTPKGVAGGLFDISPYSIDSRVNGENDENKMMFGMGAVQGEIPGTDVRIPAAGDTADKFEGLILTGFTNQMNLTGEIKIFHQQTVGILRFGKAWARVVSGITPSYGDDLYLVKNGNDAGLFTNVADGHLAVNGRFIGDLGTGDIAPVEIYNQKA